MMVELNGGDWGCLLVLGGMKESSRYRTVID